MSDAPSYRDDPDLFGATADSTHGRPALGKPEGRPTTDSREVAASADWKDGTGPLGADSPLRAQQFPGSGDPAVDPSIDDPEDDDAVDDDEDDDEDAAGAAGADADADAARDETTDPARPRTMQDDAVTSRSADPGQGSYGGFKDEGSSRQNVGRTADRAAGGS